MVLAVLASRSRLPLAQSEIYTATVGGVQLREPAADLALALAVASAVTDRPLPTDLVAIGEVGLAGEVRTVTGITRRLAEAVRFGFTRAVVPVDPGPVPEGMTVVQAPDLRVALQSLLAPVGRAADG
jgi:DNA repair protein RadA/Sms